MNKFKLFIGIASIALLGACTNAEKEATPATTETNSESTSIKVNDGNVEVGTEDGKSSTEVKVSKDGASFESKK